MCHIAPKSFQLKPHERKLTVAESPFSENREYDIPKSDGFAIHKSDKPLTEFMGKDTFPPLWKVSMKRGGYFINVSKVQLQFLKALLVEEHSILSRKHYFNQLLKMS